MFSVFSFFVAVLVMAQQSLLGFKRQPLRFLCDNTRGLMQEGKYPFWRKGDGGQEWMLNISDKIIVYPFDYYRRTI